MEKLRYPSFYIVGAAKCGTTSLFDYLCQHPKIFSPPEKEPNYFAVDLFPSWYISLKTYLDNYSGASKEQIFGDASVAYLYSERAAERIKECRPDANIIIILRNPVDMMYSLYAEFRFQNWEPIESFKQALAAEEDRKNGVNLPKNASEPRFLFYRERAKYTKQIERYFRVFGRERVRIIFLDKLKEDPAAVYKGILQFLDVDDAFEANFDIVNSNKTYRFKWLHKLLLPPVWVQNVARKLIPFVFRRKLLKSLHRFNLTHTSRKPIDLDLKRRLHDDLKSEIQSLEDLLELDLSRWRN